MYERFFGLKERPFELTPNPRFLVLTASHEEALSNLEYGIAARKGITVLLGAAGTGKTTLLRKALALKMRRGDRSGEGWAYLNNPTLTRDDFFETIADAFHLDPPAFTSKARLLRALQQLVVDRHRRGLTSVLIVDEAQSLPIELLEELRLLANIESDTDKFLPLVLAGQPEFGDRLRDPALRQFKQRIVLRCRLEPLDLRETASYVAARIRMAGGEPASVFTRDAIVTVHEASGGIPRIISVICDNALLSAFAVDERPVEAATVEEVCAEFDFESATDAPSPILADIAGWRRGPA